MGGSRKHLFPIFSHQHIAKRAVQAFFESQLDPRGPNDSRGGLYQDFYGNKIIANYIHTYFNKHHLVDHTKFVHIMPLLGRKWLHPEYHIFT